MRGRQSGDDHRVHLRVGYDLLRGRRPPNRGIILFDPLQHAWVGIARHHDATIPKPGEIAEQVLAPVPDADLSDSYHCPPPFPIPIA